MDKDGIRLEVISMPNPYTISTVDSSEYKRLLCGRTNDITILLDHILQGHSVALFGERRIGKTSLLWLLRDIANDTIDNYKHELIDKTFQDAIPTLSAKTRSWQVVYLNVQGKDPKTFTDSMCNELSLSPAPESDFVACMQAVNNNLSDDQRVVFLLDEVDGLLDFDESKQIFRSLRSIVQSCPRICLVLAGAEFWYRAIKDKTSPLVNNVYTFYLKSAETYSIERYLVEQQLTTLLPTRTDINSISRKIREWTGDKPYYTQAVCYEIVNVRGSDGSLPSEWEPSVENKVMTAVKPTLDAFFEQDNLDDVTRKILALLANKPGLSIKEIARGLGLSEKSIWNAIVDLEALYKVRRQGSDYHIVGTLLETYGKTTQEIPRIKSKWPQRLKWATAIVLVSMAIWVYWYTHPPLQTSTFAYPSGIVTIRMPSSLEQDETGASFVSVHNTTASETYSVTLSLVSNGIDYQRDGGNRVTLTSLHANEIKYWEPNFSARSPLTGSVFSSDMSIIQDTNHFSATYPFEISQRVIPVKKYWAIISLLFVTISGFLTKQDLSQLAASLFAGLLKPRKDAEKKEGA